MSWKLQQWKSVLEIKSGRSQKQVKNLDGKYPIYGSGGIMGYADDFICNEGTIIIGRKGTINNYVEEKFWNVDTAFGLSPSEYLDSKFLYYFCLGYDFTKHDKGTTLPSLVKKDLLANVFMAVPPLAEQKRIVEILDEAFEAIALAEANTKKNLDNARELFESYLNKVFTEKDSDWENIKLGDIADFRNGLNFTKGSKGEVVKIVGVKDFQDYFWIQEGELESVTTDGKIKEIDVLKKGDILAVRSNGNKELIGRCILADDLSEKTSHSGFTIRIRLNKENIYPQFIVYFLKSKELRKQLTESGGGISISSLNQKGLSLLKLALPDFKTQRQIVEQIDLIVNKTQKLEIIYQRKLEALAELKQSILQKAFTGKLTSDKF